MEEQKQGLVKSAETRLPKFVEDAYESVEKMEQFATILLNSKLVPNHFYEQLPDKKPDFSKGKVPAVVAVLIQGYQLQLPPLTALQHIIPVNGLLSIKGDLAKSMIFNSGKLKPGSWVEEETGTIDAGDYMVKITATRSDNGQTLSRSFSVGQAKRAGLWITEQQVNGQDGWKYKSSAWWKYPTRMCNYRALGFIARDMFPDVMAGIYTTEEAMDIPKDAVEVIETESGAKITIPDKEHSKARSSKMTDRVSDKIPDNKFGSVKNENITDATVVDEKKDASVAHMESDKSVHVENNELKDLSHGGASSYIPEKGSYSSDDNKGITAPVEAKEELPGNYTLVGLEKMDTEVLKKIVMEDMDMMEASEIMAGKNTKQKLAKIIFAHQSGELAQLVAPYIKENEEKQRQFDAAEAAKSTTMDAPPANTSASEIAPNKSFDAPAEHKGTPTKNADLLEPETKKSANKYAIDVPEYDKDNARDFSTVKFLFNRLMGVTPQITTPVYMALAEKLGLLTKYPDKEGFLKLASVDEINLLLNSN